MSMTDTRIPVLDASSPDLVEATSAAYQNVGFAYVENFDVEPELITRLFEMNRRFHAQPLSTKTEVALDSNHRGYIAIDTSTDRNSDLAEVTQPNQSESFMMMREAAPDDPDVLAGAYLAGPNQWPALPGFKDTLLEYDQAMNRVARQFVSVFAACLNTDVETFSRFFERPTTWLRLLHYPPTPADTPDDVYGSAPHCDFGFITLLAQDDIGGLQVQHPQKGWIDVPPRPGSLILNSGNMLHRWSNGKLRSTPHRVINKSEHDRYSCAYFFDPNVLKTIQPLKESISQGASARFEPVRFGEYLQQELEAAYDQHTGTRDADEF